MDFMINGRVVSDFELRNMKEVAEKDSRKKRAKTVSDIGEETRKKFLGFRVAGFSPEDVSFARMEYERIQKQIPFNVEYWMSKNRPRLVRTKPFEIESAALDAKKIAENSGWIGVTVTSIIR